jgi:SAM-dependent methyltransferase
MYTERVYFSPLQGRLHHIRRLRYMAEVCRCTALDFSSVDGLDVGCHDLFFYHLLGRPHRRFVGIDVNWEDGLGFARRNVEACGWSEVAVVEGQAENLPFPDRSFDVAYCFETIEHMTDYAVGIGELDRVLRPAGIAFVSFPIEMGPTLLVKQLLRRVVYFGRPTYTYRWGELWHGVVRGDLTMVDRHPCGHKGFDYRAALRQFADRGYQTLHGNPFPFPGLPAGLNLTYTAALRKPA